MPVSKRVSQLGSLRGRHLSRDFSSFHLNVSLAETNRVVQVKYTNQSVPHGALDVWRKPGGKVCFWFRKIVDSFLPASVGTIASLSISGSNQAREGRLVDALAVRGDERRDTLR